MDWAGFWNFLSNNIIYLYLLLFFGGGTFLHFLRKLYEARQDRLKEEARARVRVAELELEKERERYRPKAYYTLEDMQQPQGEEQPYEQGLPPQQQW